MSPIDYRNITWDGIQNKIAGNRLAVLAALREHGPCTTRALAAAMHWDILHVRPRVTELLQLGFAECLDLSGHEGTYRAFTDLEAFQFFRARKFHHTNPQLQLL